MVILDAKAKLQRVSHLLVEMANTDMLYGVPVRDVCSGWPWTSVNLRWRDHCVIVVVQSQLCPSPSPELAHSGP